MKKEDASKRRKKEMRERGNDVVRSTWINWHFKAIPGPHSGPMEMMITRDQIYPITYSDDKWNKGLR